MTTTKFCSECGTPTLIYGGVPVCAKDAEHSVDAGGFYCPSCGDATTGDDREGTACFACRSQE